MTSLSNLRASAILAAVLAGLWAAPLGADSAAPVPPITRPGVAAADNACLKYLPGDWWLVGNVDIKVYLDFLASSAEGQNNPMVAMLDQYMELIRGITGVDLRTQVKYSTVFFAGDPEKDLKALVAVQGSFDNRTVETRLGMSVGQNARKITHLDTTIYVMQGAAYCFPEKSTVLIGDLELVKGAIAAGQKPPTELPEAMKKTLAMTNAKSVVWAALRPQAILGAAALKEWREQNKDFCAAMKPIQCASIWFDAAADGFLVNGLATVADAAQADALKSYLQRRKKELLEAEGANVFFASFLVLSDLTSRGEQVKGSVRLTLGALGELWNTRFILKPAAKVEPARL